ncbi:MAG TPA: hypothetical protein VGD80_29275, partial [Kofleriaceae bacterium]
MRSLCAWTLAAAGGCSLAVDTSVAQCSLDIDCERFGGHPLCQDGVCVPSGLGPPGCFVGDPVEPAEFASQCTMAQIFEFDNCARLQMCDAAALAGAFTISAPPQDLGTVPSPITSQPVPTVSCSAVAPNSIYVTGSTNLPPLIKAVQPLLYA